jgi:hypothetical protein
MEQSRLGHVHWFTSSRYVHLECDRDLMRLVKRRLFDGGDGRDLLRCVGEALVELSEEEGREGEEVWVYESGGGERLECLSGPGCK